MNDLVPWIDRGGIRIVAKNRKRVSCRDVTSCIAVFVISLIAGALNFAGVASGSRYSPNLIFHILRAVRTGLARRIDARQSDLVSMTRIALRLWMRQVGGRHIDVAIFCALHWISRSESVYESTQQSVWQSVELGSISGSGGGALPIRLLMMQVFAKWI